MKALFTIVAKNYLPLAYTLKKSIAEVHPDLDFFVFVTSYRDEEIKGWEELFFLEEIEGLGINIPNLTFKYNITEFCTSIKPSCFELLEKKGYKKIIYFDPDVCVYNSLNFLFDHLEENFLLLTPHYCSNETNFSGVRNEGMILFSGVYNLGFCGVHLDNEGSQFIQWWKKKLLNLCYIDKTEGLHVDQKWIELVPCIFDNERIKIIKNAGTNAAIWNMHERTLIPTDSSWKIKYTHSEKEELLVFYHFSSFNYYDDSKPNKLYPNYTNKFPALTQLVDEYYSRLYQNDLSTYRKYDYEFNYFDNGNPIIQLHRRIYRRLIDQNILSLEDNPFKTGNRTFHHLLKNSKLLVRGNQTLDSQSELKFSGFKKKVNLINQSMRLLKSVIGTEKYFLLIKFFQRYSRFENQTFLIKEISDQYEFLNENR